MTYLTPLESSQASANLLDNGGFEIWQRGTSFSNGAAAIYADRWWWNFSGSTPTYTISKNTSVVDTQTSSLQLTLSSIPGGTGNFYVYQTLENLSTYLGKTLTLYVRVNTTIGGNVINAGFYTDANGFVGTNYHPGDGNWHTLTGTITISNSSTFMQVRAINFNNNTTTGTVYVDSAMLVYGSDVVAFIPLHPAIDILRCQRYYETGYTLATQYMSTGGFNWSVDVQFQAYKRTTPTITLSNVGSTPSSGNTTAISGGVTVYSPSSNQFIAYTNPANNGYACGWYFNWAASADL